jgi:hypothetical protein
MARAGQIFTSLVRESARISHSGTQVRALERMGRRRSGGGYLAVRHPPAGFAPTNRVALTAPHVHVAVGYRLKFSLTLAELAVQRCLVPARINRFPSAPALPTRPTNFHDQRRVRRYSDHA